MPSRTYSRTANHPGATASGYRAAISPGRTYALLVELLTFFDRVSLVGPIVMEIRGKSQNVDVLKP